MSDIYLFNAFIFLAAACLTVPLASRLKLGAVLGYILAGVAIGPYAFGLIGNAEQIMHFAEFGVVMMLFVIGLELEPSKLWRLRKAIVGHGGLQVVLTSLAFMTIGVAHGFAWQPSLAIGMALSLSSTAIVLQILEERNLLQTSVGETSFSVLLFQDIAVIPMLVIIPLLANYGVAPEMGEGVFAQLPGWQRAIAVAAVIVFVVAVGRFLSPWLFHAIAKTNLREVFTAASLVVVVGITLLMEIVGVSPALGAFVAGVVLANSEYKHTLEADIAPFKGLLLGLFFISVGMSMDFDLLSLKPLAVMFMVLGLLVVKFLILCALGYIFGLPKRYNLGVALVLAQGGEFAFVLLKYAANLNVISGEHADLFTLAVTISMAITPLLIMLYTRFIVPLFMSVLPERNYDEIDPKDSKIILAGYGRFGQIIGRFLSAQGVKMTILEKDLEQIDLLRKFGFKGYFGDPTRLEVLDAAGAGKAKMLIVTVDDPDDCTEIVRIAKQHYPKLKVYARARDRRHAYELNKLGVDYFKRETFESALMMAQEVMKFFGHDAHQMRLKAKAFRKHDEASLRKSFEFFDEEEQLISFARDANTELEKILQNDIVVTPKTKRKA